ncbi:hypothetical protein [Larkinella humicola]|uniref:Uncharacterized protein n=1 Tax=Larkinella humicola TaxID=2607654 RepID=A0A5N1J3K0_9BACT|nr:hypothetical protein [Larkinella humicola]KAA9341112.1 hypothetical protein F0P93_30195 [Larkinella humicola]
MKSSTTQFSFLNRPLCLWLAVSVLLGSSGFVVVDHWCLMRGEQVKVRLMPNDCQSACDPQEECPMPEKSSGIHKTPCCSQDCYYNHLKTEQSNLVQVVVLHPVEGVHHLPFNFRRWLTVLFPVNGIAFAATLLDNPLIHSGRFRLISLSIWLV